MKVRNKKLICTLAMALISATSLQAYAVSPTTTGGVQAEGYSISPRWASIEKILPQILSNGTTVSAGAYVKASSSTHKITGTYILEKKLEVAGQPSIHGVLVVAEPYQFLKLIQEHPEPPIVQKL